MAQLRHPNIIEVMDYSPAVELLSDPSEVIREMARVRGVECIGLSTNAVKLAAFAQPLRAAGVRTANISLDALTPEVYRRVKHSCSPAAACSCAIRGW